MKNSIEKKHTTLTASLIVFSILALLVFAAGMYFSYSFASETENLTAEANQLELEANNQTASVQRYNRVLDYQAVVGDTLPNSKDVSSFVADVENIATKNNVFLDQSTFGVTGSKVKQTNLDLSQTINRSGYYEMQIKYTASGSYQSFLSMLSDLKNLRRLNTISELNIVKDANDDATDKVIVNFVASIYIKK